MRINPKKLKRRADVGDRLDLVPLVIIVICLFGIGIFYICFRANFLPDIITVGALFLFSVVFVISLLLYGIGEINRRAANKTVFNYVDEKARAAAGEICQSENAEINLNLSITKRGILFTLSCGDVSTECDFTSANKLPSAALLFISVCLGVIAEKLSANAANGKSYNNVVYEVVINEDPSPKQYFFCNGEPNADEIDRALLIYKNTAKKYRKKKNIK